MFLCAGNVGSTPDTGHRARQITYCRMMAMRLTARMQASPPPSSTRCEADISGFLRCDCNGSETARQAKKREWLLWVLKSRTMGNLVAAGPSFTSISPLGLASPKLTVTGAGNDISDRTVWSGMHLALKSGDTQSASGTSNQALARNTQRFRAQRHIS